MIERLSLNVWTTKGWSLPEAVAGCVRAGIPGIGLWRDKVEEVGVEHAVKLIADAGLTGVPLRPAATFTLAFIVAADRSLSPVGRAFADLVATRQP